MFEVAAEISGDDEADEAEADQLNESIGGQPCCTSTILKSLPPSAAITFPNDGCHEKTRVCIDVFGLSDCIP